MNLYEILNKRLKNHLPFWSIFLLAVIVGIAWLWFVISSIYGLGEFIGMNGTIAIFLYLFLFGTVSVNSKTYTFLNPKISGICSWIVIVIAIILRFIPA